MGDNAIAIRQDAQPALGELTVDQVLAQVEKIQTLMTKAMKVNEHFGVIPGTNKPTLLKPGAEKLCFMFRLSPDYTVQESWQGPHVSIISTCTLTHISSGAHMGSGMGSCSTRESKYAYRKAARACPKCGKESIIKSAADYGGGWACWKKKDGCGAKFADNAPEIVSQPEGRTDNPDLADQYNTVLKMSNKRALIAAVLNVTAASDIFTQDMEDIAVAREELRAESTVQAVGDDDREPAAQSKAEPAGKRLKMRKDEEPAVPGAKGGSPTPPPGDSVVMVDDKVADALLDRCTKTKVIVDAMMRQLGETRKRNGGGPAPKTLRDITSDEARWLDKVLTARERQQTAA
jgi:hypothetical protein